MGIPPTFSSVATQADLGWWIYSRPLAFIYQTSTQSAVATSTWTPVQLNTSVLDRDSGWPGGTSGRYTIGLTLGYYLVSGAVFFPGNGGTVRQAKLVLNGTDVPGAVIPRPTSSADVVVIPPVLVRSTAIGDYVELQCYQDSGAPMDLTPSGGAMSHLLVRYEGT